MVPAPPNVSRHFLPWDRPLLPQAVGHLARNWNGEGPLDLSDLLVVVPTRHSGRRLREALAARAAERNQAAFPPRVLTPEALIAPAADSGAASRLDSLLAWVEVFRELDLSVVREVFPVDPPARGFGWALRLAEQFSTLQSDLAEAGLRLADVPAKAGPDFPEAQRWRELGELERAHDEKLRIRGRIDPQAARIEFARRGMARAGIARMVVIGTPDPLSLTVEAIAACAAEIPVEIVVFAPDAEADAFDGWGRPLAASWERRALALPDFEGRVHLCADPAAQADGIVAVAKGYGDPAGWLGAGVADAEVLPVLESALKAAGFRTFNPEGRPRARESLHPLLAVLARLAREPDFESVEALSRCPAFLAHLGRRIGGAFSAARWLKRLDELRSLHLPADLAAARAHAAKEGGFPELAAGLEEIEKLRERLAGGTFASGAEAALASIFAGSVLDLGRAQDRGLADDAKAWNRILGECEGAAAVLPTGDWWDLALRLYGGERSDEEKPAEAVELLGWLELLWEDAPHVAVAGFNDGSVPGAVAGDPFLPENMRAVLGLKTNGARFARDAYLLTAIASCRESAGRIDLFVGKASAAGDPRRPSRLLFRCGDAELARRVEFLFRAAPEARAGPPWRRAWTLRPPSVPAPTRMPVTAFRDHLFCPFRFYLRHGLRLATVDPLKSELDALDFGKLCHSALEAMGREPGLRDCTDPAELRAFLLDALERQARERYGRDLALPVAIQLESARQRLGRAAEVQAAQRAGGWVIERTEEPFTLEIGGLAVSGKIDRIERHSGTGLARLLDYKTSDTPQPPSAAHCRRAGRAASQPREYARFTMDGGEWTWTDLQLPLYIEALRRRGGAAPAAGYFNLPKAVGQTAVETWDGYDDALHAAALRCAEGVAIAVSRGIFWPPAEPGDRDDPLFDGFFQQGTAESVDPGFAAEAAFR